jgi:hypothetical protein
MGDNITSQTVQAKVSQTAHVGQQYTHYLIGDLQNFLNHNPACLCSIVSYDNGAEFLKVFQIRGSLMVKVPSTQKDKSIGFKFILTKQYPVTSPIVFLDEAENQEIIDNIDYVDVGNVITFDYLSDWKREEASWNPQASYNKFNLNSLLFQLYNLFVKMPPLPMSDLFGIADEQPDKLFDVFLGFQEEEEIGNFNPVAEIGRIKRSDSHLDSTQQKDIWMTKYKLKLEMDKKVQNDKLIKQDLLPKLKTIASQNMIELHKQEAEFSISKLKEFEENQKTIEEKLVSIKNHNQEMKEAMPAIDEQIWLLEEQIKMMEQIDLNPENLKDLFTSPNPAIEKLKKYEIKKNVYQELEFGLKARETISDVP